MNPRSPPGVVGIRRRCSGRPGSRIAASAKRLCTSSPIVRTAFDTSLLGEPVGQHDNYSRAHGATGSVVGAGRYMSGLEVHKDARPARRWRPVIAPISGPIRITGRPIGTPLFHDRYMWDGGLAS